MILSHLELTLNWRSWSCEWNVKQCMRTVRWMSF